MRAVLQMRANLVHASHAIRLHQHQMSIRFYGNLPRLSFALTFIRGATPASNLLPSRAPIYVNQCSILRCLGDGQVRSDSIWLAGHHKLALSFSLLFHGGTTRKINPATRLLFSFHFSWIFLERKQLDVASAWLGCFAAQNASAPAARDPV